ncbi:MAG: MBL fold metallo-hydrolase [Bacteroidia bacterium]|nr:MBL fold metallo-hydrolase [Bacteroidia bacterium]MBT8229324.1 MBL fold metallo-hydrolase [Bacteroidia bacterium]NNK89789.1 MBL fold metallo-hydrolase [Saprospiraceae bacterium]
MKITALGTGTSQGVPILGCSCKVCLSKNAKDKRLRSSVFIEYKGKGILIDIGPDFRQQFLTNNLHTVDAILLTHEHNDHIIGLDEIRAINFTQKKSIPFYARSSVAAQIKSRFPYAFPENPFPGMPRLDLHIIDESSFQIDDIKIHPIKVMHGNLSILGFRINNFAYITDANHIPESELDKLKDLDVLIINALQIREHYSHFNLEQSLEEIKKINPKKAFLTHISHNLGLAEEIEAQFPVNVRLLHDRMEIIL